jgi:acyl-CoA reductase-like NAD-dependent aldehyde dehydrogenase
VHDPVTGEVVGSVADVVRGVEELRIGREGSHDGLEEYFETEYVAIGGM